MFRFYTPTMYSVIYRLVVQHYDDGDLCFPLGILHRNIYILGVSTNRYEIPII